MSDAVEHAFNAITGALDYPMVVVTASAGGNPGGCLVGFSTQCSIHPPRYLVCLSDKNRTERLAREAAALGVHFLAESQTQLAALFGAETTDEDDTFARCRWHPGPSGTPILDGCDRWFVGRILERHRLGDHIGFVLEPVAACAGGDRRSLRFSQVRDLSPGHPP